MVGYNKRKIVILEAVLELGSAKSIEVLEHLWEKGYDIKGRNVRVALVRYHRQGLLSRKTVGFVTKVYTITEKGIERLLWLQKNI